MRRFYPIITVLIMHIAVSHAWAENDSVPDNRDIVLYAGGVVEVRPPLGWHIAEVPFGREVRLLVTPQPIEGRRVMPTDGMWITFHAQSIRQGFAVDTIQEVLQKRLKLSVKKVRLAGNVSIMNIADYPAVKQEFTIGDGLANQPNTSDTHIGFHVLIRSTFGILELHAVAPATEHALRKEQFESTISTIVLKKPQDDGDVVVDSVSDAKPVIGSWKAFRSRLRLYGDGRIVIRPDRPSKIVPQRIDKAADGILTGRYEARGDLIFVRWDDGSRQNLRWRRHNENLLITDHDGQISQLRRIFE